jgi:hypothetical protein
LASAAVITTYALSPYNEKNNHVAVLEGWVIYLAFLIAVVEKYSLADKYWKGSFEAAVFSIKEALIELWKELKERKYFVEGNALTDWPFYRGRMTWLVSLVAILATWENAEGIEIEEENEHLQNFVKEHLKELFLWGEAAIPQFLAIFWHIEQTVATMDSDSLLQQLIKAVSERNCYGKSDALPDPYHDLGEVILGATKIKESSEENFIGRSYTLESLVELYVRRGWRRQLSILWSDISKVDFAEFLPPTAWEYCLWESEHGYLYLRRPNVPQSWSELQERSHEVEKSLIPAIFQSRPILLCIAHFEVRQKPK